MMKKMNIKIKGMKQIILAAFATGISVFSGAQITILNTNLNSMNVTPQSLCQVSIMNGSGGETQAVLEARILNNSGENILAVKTFPFTLAAGMNNGITINYNLESTQYGATGQGEYVRNTHILPSGNFKYCVSVYSLSEGMSDDLCEDVISDLSSFLNLIYPNDKDTVETVYPVLTWSHSEPFNILSPGDHFKIIVVEMNQDQSAESAVTVNIPVYFKEFLSSHQIQYPIDAKMLEEGKRYAWQVQKLSNGTILEKTEAWEFTLHKNILPKDNKYTTLKKKHDGGYYLASNDKIFFRFTESYSGTEPEYRIINEKREEMKPEIKNDKKDAGEKQLKHNGANYYEIDLKPLKLKKGFYELEVFNSKKEKYVLKFKTE